MKTRVRKTLSVGVLAAGALLLAPGAAQADAGTKFAEPVRKSAAGVVTGGLNVVDTLTK